MPPLSMVGDMGGGGMLAAFGIACALREVDRSGEGQVIDAAMVDGVAALSALWHGMLAQGRWSEQQGANFTDPGAPHYDVYETSDHRFVAVGALEDPFWVDLLDGLGLEADELPSRADPADWPALHETIADAFAQRTRDEWTETFAVRDACVAPVLTFSEAAHHPHLLARGTYVVEDDVVQARPAPRFSRTSAELSRPPSRPGEHTDEILVEAGFTPDEVERLRDQGAVA
jgi:alpha-methylacyl-CoA racemase